MKLKKVLAVLVAATMLVACGTKDGDSETETKANYAKVGYAINTSTNGTQVNTTMAVVGLDEDDKIKYVSIDVAQQKVDSEDSTKTKKEKEFDYKMVGNSSIGKEWFEQIEALENHITGMSAAEIKAIQTYDKGDGSHTDVPAVDSELAASVTITIGDYVDTVVKAIENAVKVDGLDKIGMGQETTIGSKITTSISFVALDSNGKVVWSLVDAAYTAADEEDPKTKLELGADYKMKGKSTLGKEWDEQAEEYSKYIIGKTKAEIAAFELVESDGHVDVPAEGTDLAASVSISLTGIQAAVIESIEKAK